MRFFRNVKTFSTFNNFNNYLKPTRLGRWEHKLKPEQQEIKLILNNSDHCGDVICGDPVVVKNIIDTSNSSDTRDTRYSNKKNNNTDTDINKN